MADKEIQVGELTISLSPANEQPRAGTLGSSFPDYDAIRDAINALEEADGIDYVITGGLEISGTNPYPLQEERETSGAMASLPNAKPRGGNSMA